MITITFTIIGNHQNLKGNPIPYLRMTYKELKLLKIPDYKMRSKSGLSRKKTLLRYLNWKDYIRTCLQFAKIHVNYSEYGMRATKEEIAKATRTDRKVQLDCMIYFANKKHGDPENIRKSIQDSIFAIDKYVVGNVDYQYDKENPRVEVTIKERGE